MKKVFIITFLALVLSAFAVSNVYAADIEFGDIDIPEGYGEAASHTPSYSFQLWHYSGGYWGNEVYNIKLTDAETAEAIDNFGEINYKHPVTITTSLPDEVKQYLTTGDLEDVKIKFEITNGLRDVQVFSGIPTYSIDNNNITVNFVPKFAVDAENTINLPGMKVHVPVIPPGYGKMVYSMFTPGGTHLGQGDNIQPGDIIDSNGNLKPGKMYEYHMAGQESNYLPAGQIKIGDGTFANGGAVGLEYLFPIKATYYLPGAPDFSLTASSPIYEGDPGETIDAWITIHNTGNIAESTDIGSNWQGEGNNWTTTQFAYSKESIGEIPAKSSRTPARIPIVIPDTEKTIWFKANIDGNTPTSELNQSNNFASALVRPKAKNADVAVSINVNTTTPSEWDRVTATIRATNHGPETANVYLQIGENNGSNQSITGFTDKHNFTLAPNQSKTFTHKSAGYEAGHSTYLATKASVTNTTDPNLSNNFARSPRITWQKYISPEVIPSELESSLIR